MKEVVKIFDTHAHYDDKKYSEDLDSVIMDNYNSGVDRIINIGCDIDSSIRSIELAKKYTHIYASIGLHPEVLQKPKEKIEKDFAEFENILKNLTKEDKVLAIGEIGLDYYYTKDNKEVQKEYFLKQLELAKKHHLIAILHCRDAAEDMYNILKNFDGLDGRIVLHCFQPNEKLAKLVVEKNFMIGIGGSITYKRNDNSLNVIKSIPTKNMILETDSPYLTPVPNRGKRNESKNIIYVIKRLAEILGENEISLAKQLYDNSVEFFGI